MNYERLRPVSAHIVSLVVACLALSTIQPASAQETEQTVGVQGGRYGVGFASSWPTYGISGTIQMNETITAEAVLGFLGSVSNFGGRVWYRFNRKPNYDLYGVASAGLYRYRYTDFVGTTLRTRRVTESVLGIGGGAGIEAGIRTLFKDESLPPVFLNGEVGLAIATFNRYNFSSIVVGVGIRYRFGSP